MRPPVNRAPYVKIFDNHSDNGNYFQEAPEEINSMEQALLSTNLSRIAAVNESVHATVPK